MKPPAFQFYADDFLAGTFSMSNEERGLYITLLCRQWTQGHVTSDEVMRLGSTAAQPSINHVLTKFQPDEAGNLKNARLELERSKQSAFRALQSEKGKASAQARFNRGSTAVQPSGAPKSNSPSPSPSPVSKKEEKKLKPSEIPDEEWMASLKSNPEYSGINIDAEFRRAHEWIVKKPGRQLSRPFFTNWLSKCEKPLTLKPVSRIPDYSKLPSAL